MNMKKTTKPSLLILFLVLMGTFHSCVSNDDFEIPETGFKEPALIANSSIASIKKMVDPHGDAPVLIQGDSLILAGYVVSNDKTGNFYKELILQDAPENPTAGIVIATEASDLYTLFEPGRKVYVKLNGLYIGEDLAGVISLGSRYEGHIGRMSKTTFETHVIRSGEVSEIIPTPLNIEEVDDTKINTLVSFGNMQFPTEILGKSYGNMDNTYNVDRPLISCETGMTISMRNSGFASFKNQLLPEGSGEITAVLSKFNTEYQLSIRNTADVKFTKPRCELPGGNDNPFLVDPPFIETFEEAISNQFIDLEGWLNVNLNGGDEKYKTVAFNTNQYAQISAYNTGENPMEAWLVTPGIDLTDSQGSIYLHFDTKDGFYNGEGLSVYISTDFSGNVKAATWTKLPAVISAGSVDQYAPDFLSSGNIDLSGYLGKIVTIGFGYLGADNGITTSYQIDNIEVSGD